jgi:hypothetical protein
MIQSLQIQTARHGSTDGQNAVSPNWNPFMTEWRTYTVECETASRQPQLMGTARYNLAIRHKRSFIDGGSANKNNGVTHGNPGKTDRSRLRRLGEGPALSNARTRQPNGERVMPVEPSNAEVGGWSKRFFSHYMTNSKLLRNSHTVQ